MNYNFKMIFKYEFYNILRSRWILFYALFLTFCTIGFLYLAEDPKKALLSVSNIYIFCVPLVSVLFTTIHWYHSDRFTELLLTQPIPRNKLILSRIIAILLGQGVALFCGTYLATACFGYVGIDSLLLFMVCFYLCAVFSFVGLLVGASLVDKMKGLGVSLIIWFYFSLLHDALLLLGLIQFKDYPVDIFAAIIATINPIGLGRLTLLMHFDAPLLLGYSGAVMRNLVETSAGYAYAFSIAMFSLIFPFLLILKIFKRKDF